MKELLEYMDIINADGIDFVEISFPINDKIIASYTKEEFAKDGVYYKTNRRYWRIINGEKYYYCGENADGFRLVFATTKNKTASTQRGGGFLTFRYDTGLDWVTDLLEVAIKYEFIKRPNNMTYILVNLETGEPYQDSEGNNVVSHYI